MTVTVSKHPKDCPDQKAAAADRKAHEDKRMKRELRYKALAYAEWFEWYPPRTPD